MDMVDRKSVQEIAQGYDPKKIKVGVLGSHSAVDVCDGATAEGLPNLVVAQKGRDQTYTKYFRSVKDGSGKTVHGCVDEVQVYDRFNQVMAIGQQQMLMDQNVIWAPNRSFVAYCGIEAVEQDWKLPMVGSRNMLRSEERGDQRDYYWLLEKAGLPFPERIMDPQDIDELVVVKLHHAQKKLERGFFTASSFQEYEQKASELLAQNVINTEALEGARIERYVIGPVFNFDFFYSPLAEELGYEPLELVGIDWRFESSLDGHVRLPAPQQMTLNPSQMLPEYTVVGHNSATLRESLLERVWPLAEIFVKASKEHYDPGIIGPFCLQTCVDKDMDFFIYDVAPRIGGGTNVHLAVGHPYGNTLYGEPMSTGRRLCREIRTALDQDRIADIVT